MKQVARGNGKERRSDRRGATGGIRVQPGRFEGDRLRFASTSGALSPDFPRWGHGVSHLCDLRRGSPLAVARSRAGAAGATGPRSSNSEPPGRTRGGAGGRRGARLVPTCRTRLHELGRPEGCPYTPGRFAASPRGRPRPGGLTPPNLVRSGRKQPSGDPAASSVSVVVIEGTSLALPSSFLALWPMRARGRGTRLQGLVTDLQGLVTDERGDSRAATDRRRRRPPSLDGCARARSPSDARAPRGTRRAQAARAARRACPRPG